MTQTSWSAVKPNRFLVIGNGRLATHLKFYLQNLEISYLNWTRQESAQLLQDLLAQASHVLLAVSDSALRSFYNEQLQKYPGVVIHFSGALELSEMVGVHPLMTFGPELYSPEIYKQIPMISSSSLKLSELLPGLPNPYFQIPAEQKAYYHALCVLGGNLSSLLIRRMLSGFKELGLPSSAGNLFLQQTLSNTLKDPQTSLTGPLARKDIVTIQKNLQSLSGDAFADVYRAFIPTVFPEFIPQEVLSENSRL